MNSKEVIEKIKPYLNNELRDELVEVLERIEKSHEEWDVLKPNERRELLEKIWLEVKQEKIDELYYGLRNIRRRLGDSFLLKTLGEITGFFPGELKDIYIRLGDLGSVAEFVLSHSRQNKLDVFDEFR